MAQKRLLTNLIDLVTGTFISRVLGFLRELVTAAYYGTGKAMDLFVIAFTIPTFFRHFLGEDVVERAFMPPFKKLISQRKYPAAWQLLSSCFNLMTIALLALMAVCYLITPLLVRAIAPGLEAQFFDQAIKMTYWIMPYMLLIGLASFVGGILNFFEMNKIYSIAPAFLSIGVIIGVHYFQSLLGIYALAAGFLLGGVLEFLVQVPYLYVKRIRRETTARYHFKIQIQEQEFRTVSRESGFILLKSLLDKSVEIVNRILASFLIAGSIASLWFSQRLFQLPVAIIGLAISRSLIPYLTEKKALKMEDNFVQGVMLGIRMNFALILPTTALMIVLSDPIISLVYQRGSFDAESTHLTSIAFLYYVVGLFGLSLNAFLSRIFSVFQKNKMPLYVSIGTSILNIILNFILVKTPLKHGGIALASSIAFTINSLILFIYLHREMKGKISVPLIIKEFLQISLYCVIAGFIAEFALTHVISDFSAWLFSSLFLNNLSNILIISALISIIFLVCIILFGPKEIKQRVWHFKK